MSTNAPGQVSLSLTLDEQERAELVQLLEVALQDLRVEVHRTHSPDYREQLLKREALLHQLIKKFHHVGS